MKLSKATSIIAIATFIACIPYNIVKAQTPITALKDAYQLTIQPPHPTIIKREIIPGVVSFNRQNGCYLRSAIYTNYLDNGIALSTPYSLTGSGKTVPEWRNEYKQPWKSQVTDYEGGEAKLMLIQIGRHPSILIRVEESDKKLLDAQTLCAMGAYRIFGRNIKLIKPISEQRENNLSIQLNNAWQRVFTY